MSIGRRAKRRGFTVMEALVSLTLAGIGIAGTVGAISSLTHSQVLILQQDKMLRLANDKYQEIRAIQDFNTASGDFTDRNENGYVWRMDTNTTSITNLSTLKVTVSMSNPGTNAPEYSVSGLVFIPPQQTTTPGTTGTTGGTGG